MRRVRPARSTSWPRKPAPPPSRRSRTPRRSHVLVELARGQGKPVAPRIEARLAELVKQNREQALEKPKAATPNRAASPSQPLRTGQSQVPLERLPGGSCRRSGPTTRRRRPRPPAGAGPDRACRKDRTTTRAGEPPRRPGRGRRPTRRRTQALVSSLPASWHAGDVRPGLDLAANGGTRVLGRPPGIRRPSLRLVRRHARLRLSRSPALTRSRSTPTSAPGPARSSCTTACASCPPRDGGQCPDLPGRPGRDPPHPLEALAARGLQPPDDPGRARGRSATSSTATCSTRTTTPARSAPGWACSTDREGASAWRNLAISGSPTIPREVRLSQGDRLEGWVSSFYDETQPSRRTDQVTDQYGNVTTARRATPASRPGAMRSEAATPRSMSTTTTGRPRTASSTADGRCPTRAR